jgi:hypothetical protein
MDVLKDIPKNLDTAKKEISAIIAKASNDLSKLSEYEKERKEKEFGDILYRVFMNVKLYLNDEEKKELEKHINKELSNKKLKTAKSQFKEDIGSKWGGYSQFGAGIGPKGTSGTAGVFYGYIPYNISAGIQVLRTPTNVYQIIPEVNIAGFSAARGSLGSNFGPWRIMYSRGEPLAFGYGPFVVPWRNELLLFGALQMLASGTTPEEFAIGFGISVQDLVVGSLSLTGLDLSSKLYKRDTYELMKTLQKHPQNKTLMDALLKRQDLPYSFLAFIENAKEQVGSQSYPAAVLFQKKSIEEKISNAINKINEFSKSFKNENNLVIDKDVNYSIKDVNYSIAYLLFKLNGVSRLYNREDEVIRVFVEKLPSIIEYYSRALDTIITSVEASGKISIQDKMNLYDLHNILTLALDRYKNWNELYVMPALSLKEESISQLLIKSQALLFTAMEGERVKSLSERLNSEQIDAFKINVNAQWPTPKKDINPEFIQIVKEVVNFAFEYNMYVSISNKDLTKQIELPDELKKGKKYIENIVSKIIDQVNKVLESNEEYFNDIINKGEINSRNREMLNLYKNLLIIKIIDGTGQEIDSYNKKIGKINEVLYAYNLYNRWEDLKSADNFFSAENTDEKNKLWLQALIEAFYSTESVLSRIQNKEIKEELEKIRKKVIERLVKELNKKDGKSLYEKYKKEVTWTTPQTEPNQFTIYTLPPVSNLEKIIDKVKVKS